MDKQTNCPNMCIYHNQRTKNQEWIKDIDITKNVKPDAA